MAGYILIVDDEPSICEALEGILADEGYQARSVADGPSALRAVEAEAPELVLLDVWLPGMDGLEVLRRLKHSHPALPVVMISGHGTIETAVKATRLGAFDFIEKPLDMDKILLVVRNALEMRRLEEENRLLRAGQRPPRIVGNSPAINQLKQAIEKVASTEATVLITGENGTGKELVARTIHELSPRASRPFVAVNCAAIPEGLIESELFGHEKGAFTGATTRKKGKFDLAHTGTIFLDEIGDMSLPAQAKVLRILEQRRFERVGGEKTIEVDVRVLAATNKDLTAEIAAGRFRQDLFYRLNVIPIRVPALRERPQDIPLLVEHFARELAAKAHTPPKRFTPQAIRLMQAYHWPGNVRQLRNLVEQLLILVPDEEITPAHLPPEIAGVATGAGVLPPELLVPDFKRARANFERLYLSQMLRVHGGNISQTAEAIGLERSHLHKKLKALGLGGGRNHLEGAK